MSRAGWAATWRAEAVLLEVDGVLLDTSLATCATWRWWSARVGLDADAVQAAAEGRSDRDVVNDLLADRDLEAELLALAVRREALLRTARRVRGAVSLVRSLPPSRWAIATSATPAHLELLLRRLRIEPPAVVVTAADTAVGRPDPSPHLAAIRRLGYAPGSCVAFEASPAGVSAARTAGAVTVAIGRRETLPSLAHADAARSDLGGVQVHPLGGGLEIRVFREPRILP